MNSANRSNLGRLIRTVRHLRPIQITNRLSRRLSRAGEGATHALAPREPVNPWRESIPRSQSLLAADRIELIGLAADISSPDVWRDSRHPKLWLYQLHYFDDLNAGGREQRAAWHRALMDRWLAENPPGSAIAWDPYPISLRVVNWIKWQLSGGGRLTERDLASLSQQVRYLLPRLEHHLLGNHLLENYKTLLIAGCFFSGAEADDWRERGLHGLHEQVVEQILPDGAHNELAPMYQGILAEGLLDAMNVMRCFGFEAPAWLVDVARRMVGWSLAIAHPDGDWPQFNDTALAAAPRPGELADYLARLGREPAVADARFSEAFRRIEWPGFTLIADVGGLGPDHNPGHGHADHLTYELSVDDRRVIVDAGISTYEVNETRAWERSTAAHNTVEIDGTDSSEVWESFRVGRRARTGRIDAADQVLAAEHDGYRHLRGSPVHRREWRWGVGRLSVRDEIRSGSDHSLRSFIHLHPHYNAAPAADGRVVVREGEKDVIRILVDNGWQASVIGYRYAPGFGRRVDAPCILLTARSSGHARFGYTIERI